MEKSNRIRIEVGKYAGSYLDTLPNSYLRWIITQKFPKAIIDAAIKKLEESSYSDLYISISRHAIDMYSKRFIHLWLQSEARKGKDGDGLATFIAKAAQEAWDNGEDVSKHRHQADGIIKLHNNIQWVFNVNEEHPDYRDVITVMPGIDE